MDWIVENKELVGGIATAIAAIASIVWKIWKKKDKGVGQSLRSGNNSTNIQAARDVNVGRDLNVSIGSIPEVPEEPLSFEAEQLLVLSFAYANGYLGTLLERVRIVSDDFRRDFPSGNDVEQTAKYLDAYKFLMCQGYTESVEGTMCRLTSSGISKARELKVTRERERPRLVVRKQLIPGHPPVAGEPGALKNVGRGIATNIKLKADAPNGDRHAVYIATEITKRWGDGRRILAPQDPPQPLCDNGSVLRNIKMSVVYSDEAGLMYSEDNVNEEYQA